MTKAQALNRYGQPKKQTVTDEGEQWIYILNYGEVIGESVHPFQFSCHADSDWSSHIWSEW